jgi:hypothetical protein
VLSVDFVGLFLLTAFFILIRAQQNHGIIRVCLSHRQTLGAMQHIYLLNALTHYYF